MSPLIYGIRQGPFPQPLHEGGSLNRHAAWPIYVPSMRIISAATFRQNWRRTKGNERPISTTDRLPRRGYPTVEKRLRSSVSHIPLACLRLFFTKRRKRFAEEKPLSELPPYRNFNLLLDLVFSTLLFATTVSPLITHPGNSGRGYCPNSPNP